MPKTIKIREPYWTAWRKYGWEQQWSVGVDKDEVDASVNGVRVEVEGKTYWLDRKDAKEQPVEKAKNNKRLYIVPRSLLKASSEGDKLVGHTNDHLKIIE